LLNVTPESAGALIVMLPGLFESPTSKKVRLRTWPADPVGTRAR
jgi:hypothetical protein